ncbi:SDR family NAD(P)-dependent oxidoreductase [Sphingobium sp. AN558]|uniref:SDR family NAD(P)-dependent oxidoreductase n=1 Tax=Sphingobium sp. AN558 TaxID=3133442 RepID=UPI0030BBF760
MSNRSFGAQSTTDEVLAGVQLAGKRILVTGVSAGLGVETARALVAHGADVVGAVRDLHKAERACGPVRDAATGGGSFELVELDLASLASVRACADALMAKALPFDVVIANAGIMAPPFGRTQDGFETQFGINHLGHFLLVNRLAPLLRAGGRVVALASSAHRLADVDLDDPSFEHTPYDPWVAYGRSKTANILFAVEFDRRFKGRGIRAVSLHPGGIATELIRHMSKEELEAMTASFTASNAAAGLPPPDLKSVPQGAATTVWAAAVADADAVGGRYCEDCQIAVLDTAPQMDRGVQPYALDAARAQALWAKSEEMVGERF